MARVSFKTKRGKRVSFNTGGRKRHGRTAQQNKLARAAKACKGMGPIGGKRRTQCIIEHLGGKHRKGKRRKKGC